MEQHLAEIGWIPIRQVCESLGVDCARNREKLLKSAIPHKLLKAKGRDKKYYKMWCVPADALLEFKKLIFTYTHQSKNTRTRKKGMTDDIPATFNKRKGRRSPNLVNSRYAGST